jgi:hypothetical protein
MMSFVQSRRKAAILAATAMLPLLGAAAPRGHAEAPRLLYNFGSGLCLQPVFSSNPYENNLTIVQEPCTGETSQLWYTVYVRDGRGSGGGTRKLYHIVNALSGQCLDDRDGITANGAVVQQYTCNNTSTTMLWDLGAVGPVGNGYLQLWNARSGKCLDLPWGSTAPGSFVWQWQCTSTPTSPNYAQVFGFF